MRKMTPIQMLFFVFTVVIFIIGGYVYSTMDIRERLETMETHKNDNIIRSGYGLLFPQNAIEGLMTKRDKPTPTITGIHTPENPDENCPDMLIKNGAELHLYNTKDPNQSEPIVFKTMDEYIQYLETQRKTGKICPILFLQKENDTQGNDVYRVRPSPFNNGAGLPISSNLNVGVNTNPIEVKDASRDNNYNTNQYAGFDPYGLYVGRVTNVDTVGMSTEQTPISDNPMDPNWGGVLHTQKAVDSGKYDENQVSRVVYPTPKTEFIPIPNPNIPPLPSPV
jgi:hypothetical protein